MAKDLRIRRAARKSGLTVGYVSRVMSGKRRPGIDNAKLIADAMGLSLDQFYREIEVRKNSIPSDEARERSAAISRGLKQRGTVKRLEEQAASGFVDETAHQHSSLAAED